MMDPRILREAEASLENMDESFNEFVGGQIKSIRKVVGEMEAHAQDCRHDISSLNGLALELSGLGATFQYPLLTRICQSLMTLLAGRGELNPKVSEAVGAHVDALTYVYAKKLQGEGDASAQSLMDNLAQAIRQIEIAGD